MFMKIALITDIHFGVRNNSDFFLRQYEKFFSNIFFPYLKNNKIDTVLILGDTWEDRKSLSPKTFKAARAMFFDRLRDLNINVKMIYGNHDVFFKDTNETNTIDVIGDLYPNIEVVEKFKKFNFDGLEIAMISWINNQNLEQALNWLNKTTAPVLCGHFEIKNFQMIKGFVCDHGFEKTTFDKFQRVFSGHFHFISDDGKIFYISNPFQTNWGDWELEKGFRILDTETMDIEFVKNPYTVFEKMNLEDVDISNFNYENFNDKIVKVYVQNPASSASKLDTFTAELSKYVHQLIVEEGSSVINDDEIEHVDFHDTAKSIEVYIDEIIKSDTIDKQKLKNIFMDLYGQALTTTEE